MNVKQKRILAKMVDVGFLKGQDVIACIEDKTFLSEKFNEFRTIMQQNLQRQKNEKEQEKRRLQQKLDYLKNQEDDISEIADLISEES